MKESKYHSFFSVILHKKSIEAQAKPKGKGGLAERKRLAEERKKLEEEKKNKSIEQTQT